MAYQQTQQQRLLGELTNQTNWDIFLTLTFPWSNYKKTHDDVTPILNKFLWHLERECYGRQAKHNKLQRYPVLEYSASEGSHIHLLMVKPDDKSHSQFKEIVRNKWLRLDGTGKANMSTGSKFYQSIDDTEADRKKVADYLNKAVESNYETVIFQSM